ALLREAPLSLRPARTSRTAHVPRAGPRRRRARRGPGAPLRRPRRGNGLTAARTESPSARRNHPASRSCWHPVAYSEDVSEVSVPVELLGEPLVVWRDSAGTAHIFSDLCIHRGTALLLGTVEGDEIVCPYHGLRYAECGACWAITQIADRRLVQATSRV